MSFTSILSDIGTGLKKFFEGSVQTATVAEPLVDVLFPGIAPLFNSVVTEVANAEAAAIAANAQSGSGAQKLAAAVQASESSFTAWANVNGYAVPDSTEIQTAVNAVVTFVNSLSAAPAKPVATT
jgi:hypothetical protein